MSTSESLTIDRMVKQLDSSSLSTVHKALHEIRLKFLKSPNEVQLFVKSNGLKYLLRFVKKPNEKILDISLSILANMCLEDDIRNTVAQESGSLIHFLSLITTIQKDSIVGRASRLIGNLAMSKTIATTLYQNGAVPKLIECIKSKDTSAGTKHMAVRALRLLWEADTSKQKMLQDQVVHTVASLLNTPVDELLQAVLKALSTFTQSCSEQCALQVQGGGSGFDALVTSIQSCSKQELPVSVIFNLCFVPEIRPLLGNAGVVEAMVSLTNGKTPEQYSSDVVSVLCLLCRESVNRSKVRRNGGLEILLETLRIGINPNVEARALNAILHFIYDEVGLEILIKEGIVPVLVSKLIKVIGKYGIIHSIQSEKNKVVDVSVSTTMNYHKRIRLSGLHGAKSSFDHDKDRDPLGLKTREMGSLSSRSDFSFSTGEWSPGSSRSVEFSPDATRTYSPSPLNVSCSPTSSALSPASQFSPPSPLSDAYSPVCGYSSSEDEKQDDSDTEAVAECDADSNCEIESPSLKDTDDMNDIKEALSVSLPSNLNSRHGMIESWSLIMLSRMSHMDSLVEDMVSSNTIDALLQYYTLLEAPHPRVVRILQRITRNHHCLVPLLRAGLVLKVNQRLIGGIHKNCSRCKDFDILGNSLLSQLSVIAESGFGEGQIMHHLMRASRPVQSLLIISVPYIIRTRKLLSSMLRCKIDNKSGQDLLLQLMTDELGDGLSHEAIDSVCHLLQHMGAQNSHRDQTNTSKACHQNNQKCSKYGGKIFYRRSCHDIITLELDDGASIQAERGDLCEESPMFSAMLMGDFFESRQQCISLKGVSEESLIAILSLLYAPKNCHCFLTNHDIDFAFEILQLADRFILSKVVDKVADWLLDQLDQLDPNVISSFYLLAQDLRHVQSISEKLSRESLNLALSNQIDRKLRHKIFHTLFSSHHKNRFLDDLSELIKVHIVEPFKL